MPAFQVQVRGTRVGLDPVECMNLLSNAEYSDAPWARKCPFCAGLRGSGSHAGLGFVYCRQGEGRRAAGEFLAAARRKPKSGPIFV